MIKPLVQQKIELLSQRPGCYLMKDSADNIIYVGKAKSLIKRVKQYFTRPQIGKVQRMVMEVEDFDTIETDSEKEALLLEINLIQKYYPKYNILLKDGKMYPFIAIKKKGEPYLKIARKDTDKNFMYFGPYPNSGACYQMIDLINKLFPLRKCKTLPNKPCLYYHLNQCLGPCINKISEEKNKEIVQQISGFLNGNENAVRNKLVEKMKKEADNLDFEKANEYKMLIESIDHIHIDQKIMMQDHIDRDVIGYSIRDNYLGLMILTYRRGVLLGKDLFVVEAEDDLDEQMSTLIYQYYLNHHNPKEVIIANSNIATLLHDVLKFKVIVPFRGVKKDLLMLAIENAKKGIDEHFQTARLEDNNLVLLEELGKLLNINTPLDIELFDNSHTAGSEAIGVMVKYVNGVKVPSMYRKFKINQENKQDDMASMKEVIYRRLYRLMVEKSKFPDLIIVDGGLTQIEAASEVVSSLKVPVSICGLYKNDKHQTEGIMTLDITCPIDHKSPLFFMLVRMQDEVHRYAITFHRNLRQKSMFTTIFDDIEGIGKERKRRLLSAYPSLEILKKATKEELLQIIPPKAVDKLLKIINTLSNN